jgi:asparagine synthase (glutamine-hydrolysing)
MCGFVGQINLNRSTISSASIESSIEHLRSRGPDARGHWNVDGVAFAFNRLAIIDLDSRSNQPFFDFNERYVLMFNGEIYNYFEIRPILEAKGYSFRTSSDTEVLLYSILEWGESAFERFNGMFAIALWDRTERRLLLARDRMGVKPLFVDLSVPHSLRFASTLGALTFLDGTRHQMNVDALSYYFENLYIPAPQTAIQNVVKLPPGHVGYYEPNGQFHYHAWWTPQIAAEQGYACKSEVEAIDRLDELLRQAVKYRLVSDVPVGAFLSGGIDSSLIVAYMQAIIPGQVKTFTIGFDEVTHDESNVARQVASHFGTDHLELILKPQDLLAEIDGLPLVYDEPFADVSAIPTLLVSKLARTKVTVALSGDGGDELFGGYPYYAYAMRYQGLQKFPKLARQGLGLLGEKMLNPTLSMGLQALKTDDTAALLSFMRSSSKAVNWSELLSSKSLDTTALFRSAMQWRSTRIPAVQAMAIDLVTYLPDDILAKVDRASMAYSLEARNPFLDKNVIAFALAQPDHLLWNAKKSKHLLRKILSKSLPEHIVNQPKRGFAVPIRSWFRGPLRNLVGDLVSSTALASDPVLNGAVVDQIVQEHFSGQRNHENLLWAIIQYQRWKSVFRIS